MSERTIAIEKYHIRTEIKNLEFEIEQLNSWMRASRDNSMSVEWYVENVLKKEEKLEAMRKRLATLEGAIETS